MIRARPAKPQGGPLRGGPRDRPSLGAPKAFRLKGLAHEGLIESLAHIIWAQGGGIRPRPIRGKVLLVQVLKQKTA